MTTGKKQSIIESFMGVVREVDANKKKKQKKELPPAIIHQRDEEIKTAQSTNRESQNEHNIPHESNRGEQLMFEAP